MRRFSLSVSSALLIALSAAACTSESGSSSSKPTTTSQTDAIAQGLLTEKDMIVIFRDQMPALRARADSAARVTAINSSHVSIIAALNSTKVRPTTSFGLINALSAKLSQSEVESLSLRSDVLAVVPDRMIRLPKRFKDTADAVSGAATRGPSSSQTPALCNTLEPEALQVMNAAFLDQTKPQAQNVLDGQGKKVTGAGVKVGIIADGLDPNTPGLIRADGTNVVFSYQDFTGDPAGTATGGEEMYGDASSIAAQDVTKTGVLEYDISTYAAHSPAGPCNIRIRGVAPGASIGAYNVFSELGYTTTSTFVQAIEYAVWHDQVDILNESFGGNTYPDDTKDPISLANDAAVAAGVTVVSSSGDAGTNGTIGSPATSASSISAGASTTFRAYEQTLDGLTPFATGYVSNNVSSISSSGFAQKKARTVDLLAPGDLGWALCNSNTAIYTDCTNYLGAPTPIDVFGGTSEASPLTSGTAALIIQAYRSTHYGADPTPATVKSILMSTAQDIGAPSDEQGAGIVDALKAVTMALSLPDGYAYPAPQGTGLLASPTSFNVTAQPNDIIAKEFDVTNTGTTVRTVQPSLQKLGTAIVGHTTTLSIDPLTAPTFENVSGAKRAYVKTTFNVPTGLGHLDASIAYAGSSAGPNPELIAFALLDPTGKQIAYSIPQGYSNYAHVDVVAPPAGTYTAIFRTQASAAGYSGSFKFNWAGERFVGAGVVFPPQVTLAPGQTAHFLAALETTGEAGDSAAAIRFAGEEGEIPLTVRTLVGVGAGGGSFTATLTGGNGRDGASPTKTFAFDVPAGLKDLGAKLTVPDTTNALTAYLIDPNKKPLSLGTNMDLSGASEKTLQLNHADPQAGRWQLVVAQNQSSTTNVSSSLTGEVQFDKINITAPTLPDSKNKKISAKTPLSVPVTIHNNSLQPKLYFADARLDGAVQVAIPTALATAGATLPGTESYALLPTRATGAAFIAQSSVPLNMDSLWGAGGEPDLYASKVAPNTWGAQLLTNEVPWGAWYIVPALRGPFGPAGAPTEAVTTAAYVLMPNFDGAVTSDAGNLWADLVNGTTTFAGGTEVDPGTTGTITLTITPTAAPGTVVTGFVSIDTYDPNNGNSFGDEVLTLPYAYTVAR